MIAFTFAPQDAYPVIQIGQPDQVPLNEFTQGIAAMIPLGMKVRAREVRERYGLTAPEPGDELLEPPAPVAGPEKLVPARAPDDPTSDMQQRRFLGRLLTLCSEAPPELVEQLSDKLAADAAGALAGMTGRVRQAFDAASDLHDLAHRLSSLHLPDAEFAEAMARGMALAQLVGQADLLTEIGARR
jgi:phage gp29-like protein